MPRLLVASLALACWSAAPAAVIAQQAIAGCQVFPTSNIWNVPVDGLPVHPLSATYIQNIGCGNGVHPDFGSGLWDGGPIGIPYVAVAQGQALVPVEFEVWDESDAGPYPIPANAPIEGGPASDGDRHILTLRQGDCHLFETFYSWPHGQGGCNEPGGWCAYSGALFDLNSNALRPDTWTSGDAAGLPILPGLVRYDEVFRAGGGAGEIRHAIRFTVGETQRAYVWPARHYASSITDPAYPPMGLRLRLKANVNLSGYSPEVQVILTGLKRYGMMIADNGGDWYLSGIPDERWDNDHLVGELAQITCNDFEVVDVSSLQLDPDSAETPHLFSDGFDSGSTVSWSAAVP